MKKAMTVVMAPILPFRAKREKFGVAVPPETNEPMTRPAPPMTVSVPLDFANWSIIVPSPRETAMTMAIVPRMATSGTAM